MTLPRPFGFSWRGAWLFVLPLPLLFAALAALAKGALLPLTVTATAYGLSLGGALLARRGFAWEADHRDRPLAPPLPYKTLAAGLLALAALVAAWLGAGHSLAVGLGFAATAWLGFYLRYGLDPRPEKPVVAAGSGVDAEAVARALDEARRAIDAIDRARAQLGNPELTERLARISRLAGQIVEQIAARPRDLRRARKFLTVYLDGARQVSEGYARTHRHSPSPVLEDNFRRVLVTIEDSFRDQHRRLLDNEVLDLDVQIEVLSMQLKQEGII